MPEVVALFEQRKGQNISEVMSQVREKQSALVSAYFRDIAKYCGKVNASVITAVFESIPRQLARENKKFAASVVAPDSRFARLQSAVDWLVHAGLLIRVSIANSAEIPFAAFADPSAYKLYFFDTGLLGALCGISPSAILLESDPFKTFKGSFVENFVAQEMTCSGQEKLYSWVGARSEIEFMREVDGRIYPIEVKSGLSGKLKSLQVFAEKYKAPLRVRISAYNLQIRPEEGFVNVPLYLAGRIEEYLINH
jgi:predicted AAA+ superfamily ATPase